MIQNQTSPELQANFLLKPQQKNNRIRNQNKILICIGLSVMILILLFVGIRVIQSSKTENQELHPIVNQQLSASYDDSNRIHFLTDASRIQIEENQLTIDGVNSKDIKKLVVETDLINSYSITEFPNLSDLTLSYWDLSKIHLDSQLRLDILVVNRSNLSTFSYNSSQLKTLVLMYNYNMNTFCDSILLALTNLTIIQTDIRTWAHNSFGNISTVQFRKVCNVFPNIEAQKIQLITFNCLLSIKNVDFSQINIVSIFIQSGSGNLTVKGSPYLRQFKINSAGYSRILFENCSELIQLTMSQYYTLQEINITDCKKLSRFNVDCSYLKTIILNGTGVTAIGGYAISWIQKLIVLETPMMSLQFPNGSKLTYLQMVCPAITHDHLDILHNNSFTNLQTLKLKGCQTNYTGIFAPHISTVILESCRVLQLRLSNNVQTLYLSNFSTISGFQLLNMRITDLKIKSSNIQYITNCTITSRVQVIDCPQLKQIQKNNISITSNQLVIFKNPLLKWNQTYSTAQKANVSHMDQQYLKHISQVMNYLQYFVLQNCSFTDYVGLNFSNRINKLTISCSGQCTFGSMTSPYLQQLTLSNGFKRLFNNTFPTLSCLYLGNNNRNLDVNSLIQQLQSLKKNGTSLFEISIPKHVTKEQVAQIQDIYPGANVIIE